MQLIKILLTIVAFLTVASGVSICIGSQKNKRANSVWFLIATIGAAAWAISIAQFLSLAPNESNVAVLWVTGIYSGAILMDVALLGYNSWDMKIGKFLTLFFAVTGALMICPLFLSPEVLYSSINLSTAGNSITIVNGWYYVAYILYFMAITVSFLAVLLYRILHDKSKFSAMRKGRIVFLIGLSITGSLSLLFDLLLPLVRYDLIWIGPFMIGATILAFYYAILRYRIIKLASGWLRLMSYVVLMAAAAVVYMIIFFMIFAALFRGSTPSTEVIVLNFIMIVIVLLLSPVMSEMNDFVRSLISPQRIDLVYIIKKLSKVSATGIDMKELAAFLADHMHFEYIGFLVDGQLYGSTKRDISDNGIKMINGLGKPENGVWQVFDEKTELWQKMDLSAVAALRDANGKTFGQVLVGKPVGKKSDFNRRDLVQVETVINLVAVIIDSKIYKRS